MFDRQLLARTRKAAASPTLSRNVVKATNTSLSHRAEVVEELSDWEAMRERGAAIRDHVLDHLDRYLVEFVDNARRRGATVHFARSGAAACRIVTELARKKGASRILKAKSMATEEVGLNRAFEKRGFVPLETDLGEYIVQLAGEPPSHITAPALHRSTEEIHDLFSREGVLEGLGPPPDDRKALARWLSLAARKRLRGRLNDSDLGITGANFLVAETGTVVLVENEGNIRYSTTTPRTHVALVGIDKIVPRMADLATLLPLLTRSATGQRATTYVSLISGSLSDLHVVLLDNGRAEKLADPADRQVFRCIRCGACMNTCPVYRTIGGHAYGWTYPGPIGALLTPLLRGRDSDDDLPWLSSLCGACTAICPVKIDLHEHLLRLRDRAIRRGRRGLLERLAFKAFRFMAANPARYRLAVALGRRLQGPAIRMGLGRRWTATREAPKIASRTFRERWRERGTMDR